MLLMGCIVLAVFGLSLYGYMKFTGPGPLATDKTVEVERGGVLGIAAGLEKAGVISSANVFAAAATFTGERGKLKPGEYEFKQAMSMRDVMALIVSGKIITYKVTIPEGWTTAQALDRLRENEVLTGDITLEPAEGQLMPDTYVFQRGETRDDIVRSMMRSSQKLMDELWPQRAKDAPVKTPAEALVLASIIEKETGVPDERARVASVFANRLRQGMRLQSDPTIIYGITGGKEKLDRPLTRKDIAQTTPYNTYQINGLPPGPIANPGRASITAALAPAKTKDLYFVADGSGGHVFAATLAEHRVNVRKWREIEKQGNQDGEEVPVMDEEGTTAEAPAGNAADDTAAQATPPAPEPAPDTAGQAQQQQNSGLPSLAGIDIPGLYGDNSTAPPEAQDGDTAEESPKSTKVPIPRPKPEGVAPFTTAAAPEAASPPGTPPSGVEGELKPGSVIKGPKGLIPIPAPKPPVP
jgi:UPF0755 protein